MLRIQVSVDVTLSISRERMLIAVSAHIDTRYEKVCRAAALYKVGGEPKRRSHNAAPIDSDRNRRHLLSTSIGTYPRRHP
jgi:hypothetical protein